MRAEKLAAALRRCAKYNNDGCRACQFCEERLCERALKKAAANELDELADRCARYAEEIAVLQEKSKWVNPAERLPEYGVPVLAVVSGKTRNITLLDAVVIATFYDGWELEDYPPADELTVKWWLPMAESPEGGGGEHEV